VRPLLAWCAAALAAAGATGCLVTFDEVTPLACDGGACADATRADSGSRRRDATSPSDDARSVRDGASREGAADADPCAHVADGAACGAADACNDAPTCIGGACMPHVKADGTPCGVAPDLCHTTPLCSAGVCAPSMAVQDGTQWKPGDDNARCCHGVQVETINVDNCGVCDVQCNTKDGQSCKAIDGHYFCAPCSVGQCWSGCCSLTISAHCSPSDCCTGACKSPTVCPDGSHCQSDTVNYCSY
jgi:hypothetical protein